MAGFALRFNRQRSQRVDFLFGRDEWSKRKGNRSQFTVIGSRL